MKIKPTLLFWTLILFACSSGVVSPETSTNLSESCAFSWAQYRIDDLSQVFDASLKDLNVNVSGYASAFGEDCVYQDGRKKFGAIETDFYIDLPVSDLADFDSFGDWIAQLMPVVNSMPEDMIQGPQSGFVEYKFHKSEMDSIVVRVPIRVYNDSATGMNGETLFLFFYQSK